MIRRTRLGTLFALSLAVGCFTPSEEPLETEGDAESDQTGGGGDGPSCSEYCGLVTDHCSGDLEQYAGSSVCEATCELMTPGTNDDQLGNTVGCRIFHSILAGEEADPHCFHAGPSGDGTCGSTCESFCSLALAACTGDLAQWPDAEACFSDCMNFEPGPSFSSSLGDEDTLSCRIEHVSLAALQPDVHCEHIGVDSPVCQ